MEQREIEITGMAITARGTFNTGDILRTDEAFAKHLVEDCGAAKYTKRNEEVAPVVVPAADPVAKSKRGK